MCENVALAAATATFLGIGIHHPLYQADPGTLYNKKLIKRHGSETCKDKLTHQTEDNETKIRK